MAGHLHFRRGRVGLRFGHIELAARHGLALHGLVAGAVRLGARGSSLGGDDGGLLLIGLGGENGVGLLIGLGLVNEDLRLGLPHAAVGRGQIGLGLIHQHLIVARINFQQHVPCFDTLVVCHPQLHHRPGYPRTDKGDVTFNKSIIRLLVRRDVMDVIDDGGGGQGQHEDDPNDNAGLKPPARRRQRGGLGNRRTRLRWRPI